MTRLELEVKLFSAELKRLEREKPWIDTVVTPSGDYLITPEDRRWTIHGRLVDPEEDLEGYAPSGNLVFKLVKGPLKPPMQELLWSLSYGGDPVRNSSRAMTVGTNDPSHQDQDAREKVVGYMDRQGGRFTYCRPTKWTRDNPTLLDRAMPAIERVSEVFREHLPRRHAAQQEAADMAPNYRLGNTCFSTITVNTNIRTTPHRDSGDVARGFGVITVLCRGPKPLEGGEYIILKYGIGIQVRNGDVLLVNVHELHCNGPFRIDSQIVLNDFERLACVFYLRERMRDCLCPEEERRRARQLIAAKW